MTCQSSKLIIPETLSLYEGNTLKQAKKQQEAGFNRDPRELVTLYV